VVLAMVEDTNSNPMPPTARHAMVTVPTHRTLRLTADLAMDVEKHSRLAGIIVRQERPTINAEMPITVSLEGQHHGSIFDRDNNKECLLHCVLLSFSQICNYVVRGVRIYQTVRVGPSRYKFHLRESCSFRASYLFRGELFGSLRKVICCLRRSFHST